MKFPHPRLGTVALLGAALAASPGTLAAQHQHAGHPAGVASLTQEEVEGLRAGQGMGMALPAELNGHPGPRHVLELADSLQLTEEQRAETQALFDTMLQEAVALGEKVIAAEAALDGLFAAGDVDETTLAAAVRGVAELRGELRLTHLRTHLAMRALLSDHQRHTYDRLRGHGGEGGADGGG